MRSLLALLLGGLLTAGVAISAAPAVSHAALVASDPEDGSTLPVLPDQVTFEFNEPVGNSSEVAVTGPDGSPVPVEDVSVVDREVTATVGASGLRGEHVIAYRVVSADGHPVSGQIVVTTTDGDAAAQTGPPAETESDSFVHRHREHLLWGGLIAVVAVALIVVPLLRRRGP